MTMEQQMQFIRQTIIRELKAARGYLVPESALIAAVLISAPAETHMFVRDQLAWLEAERMAVAIRPQLGGELRWKLTDMGSAAEV